MTPEQWKVEMAKWSPSLADIQAMQTQYGLMNDEQDVSNTEEWVVESPEHEEQRITYYSNVL